jgi:hypothetical protein
MFAEPSKPRETTTRYRDVDGDGDGSNPGSLSRPAVGPNQETIYSTQQLLQEVLGETLIRNQENSDQLVQTLRAFQKQQTESECDEALFVQIVRQVLRHRLGERAGKLPGDLFEEVGRAMWTNDGSRLRVIRFWTSLGADA